MTFSGIELLPLKQFSPSQSPDPPSNPSIRHQNPPLKLPETPQKPEQEESVESKEPQPLIPGLPDDIAEFCLVRLPFPDQSIARSVSCSWNRAISNPAFLISKQNLSLSLPYIFVFAFHKSTAKLQWQAFNPRSGHWFVLPPMPCNKPVCPPGFGCASLPHQGTLFVCGGMRSDTESPMRTLLTYHTSTNSWSSATPMSTARSFFAAGAIAGKIFVAGGNGTGAVTDTLSTVEAYDPLLDRWFPVADMLMNMARYDAAVLNQKLYVTEGWSWPFSFSPRGVVYDPENNVWGEMSVGMREGWTGLSVVVNGKLFVISEHKNSRVKVYSPENDSWQYLGGGCLPCEIQRPFTVSAIEGKIYVVSYGLRVAVGTVEQGGNDAWVIEWEVVPAPEGFADFAPSNSQVLYA